MKQKMPETRFNTPRRKVLENTDNNRYLPILKDVRRILSITQALTGVTLAKLFPKRKGRSPERIQRWANIQFERYKFTFDISSLSKAKDADSIRKILEPSYFEICYLIESLPDPKPESEEERNKALYLEMAHNRAARVCQLAGWSCPGFVHWDLTGSRGSGEKVVPKTAALYESSDLVMEKFGGKCVTRHPDGNDCLLLVFGTPVAALRAAAHTMQEFLNQNLTVKGGISHALVKAGKEHSVLIPAMGLAKDLCELKRTFFCNRNDILLSSELVDYLEEAGISRDYFIQIKDVTVNDRLGKETKTLDVFRLDWQRFCEDNR